MFVYRNFIIWLLCCSLCAATEGTSAKEVALSNQEVSAGTTYRTIAVLAALTMVAAGLIAVASWILPLIAYKFCYVFGSCDYALGAYVDQFLLGKRKRSTDYVGPLLQTLADAYDLYEGGDPNDPKKNSKKGKYYRR